MVLDVRKFKANHPGGEFAIKHNIGRDVSKFFYGGYALENFSGMSPYFHSNIARRAVNSIAIAYLERPTQEENYRMVEKTKVNEFT
jgi:cytochrome b involved in lipid metabolism